MKLFVSIPQNSRVINRFFRHETFAYLEDRFEVVYSPLTRWLKAEEIAEYAADADAIMIGWGHPMMRAKDLENTSIKLIVHTGSSVADYVTDDVYEAGIRVISGSELYAESVAEGAFAYMLAGLALAIYVYAQYGNEFWTMMKEATESDVGNVDRLGGGVTNVNTIGMFTMFSALIAAYNIIFDRTTKKKTWFCLAVGIFCFMVSMAAASKKSVVILLVACICIWLYSSLGNKNSEKQLRNFLILIGCTVLFFWMINTLPIFSAISNRLNSLFDSMDGGSGTVSEANRSAFTKKGLSVWLDNFLIGGGTASSIHYLGVYAHNNYVELLMNSGIFGFALFYGIYPMTISKYFTNAITYKRQNKLSILLFSMFICVCVSGIALVYYYERYFMILMTVIFSATEIFDKETFKEVRLEGERV